MRAPAAASTIDGLLRQILREIVRGVMREELPEALAALMATAAPEPAPESRYLTPQEAAARCGVSEKTIRTWVQRGKLPASRAGRLLRIDRRDLEDYLTSGNGAPSSNRLDADALASNILFRRKGK
jgi:excisionase family DNA binding protein